MKIAKKKVSLGFKELFQIYSVNHCKNGVMQCALTARDDALQINGKQESKESFLSKPMQTFTAKTYSARGSSSRKFMLNISYLYRPIKTVCHQILTH